jgi:hypothetical protein
MIVAALIVIAFQKKHPHPLPVTFDAKHFVAQWIAHDESDRVRTVQMEDFATVQNVLSASGTQPEEDALARTFRPFWIVGGSPDDQKITFDRYLKIVGELQRCSLILSADDEYSVVANDQPVANGHDLSYVNREFPITQFLNASGSNRIEIVAKNWTGPAFVRSRIEVETNLPVRSLQTCWQCRLSGTSGWSAATTIKSTVFDASRGQSIWARLRKPGVQLVEFRRPVDIPGIPSKCSILIGADNAWDLSVNGVAVARQGLTMDPVSPRSVDVSSQIRPGLNLIHVKVWNYGGPGALFCVPTIRYST